MKMTSSPLLRIAFVVLLVALAHSSFASPAFRIKRVSDQKLAEIETLLGLYKLRGQSNNESPIGFGVSVDRIGKRYDSFEQKERNAIQSKYKRHIPSGRGNGGATVSELRLAELETLNKLNLPGHGAFDFHKLGRKRRSQSPIIDALFNRSMEPEPMELSYEELYKKR